MLRASRKILKPGGRTAFHTIVIADGLSKTQHRRAVTLGPREVRSTRPVGELMRAARFDDVVVTDVTEDFRATAQAWLDGYEQCSDEIRAVLGDEFDERQENRRGLLAAIDEGLLRRVMVTGTIG